MDAKWALGIINDLVRFSPTFTRPELALMGADFSICMVFPDSEPEPIIVPQSYYYIVDLETHPRFLTQTTETKHFTLLELDSESFTLNSLNIKHTTTIYRKPSDDKLYIDSLFTQIVPNGFYWRPHSETTTIYQGFSIVEKGTEL